MSEARKQIIDQILTFPANTYSREFLDGPHPKTNKPYSDAELRGYLEELQGSAKPVRKTQQVQQSPEVARIQVERVWAFFFHHHPEIADLDAHRKALYERALSLSDDDIVRPAHLDEAAKLLIAEGTIKAKKIPTAAELKQQAAKDSETFRQAAVQLGFSDNEANRRMVAKLGSGYSVADIAQSIRNGLQLSAVGEAEQQQRDEQERQEILEEIIGARIITRQDRLKFESMPLQQLRSEVARIREERRLHGLTGQELRAHIRSQQQQPSLTVPELPNYIARADLLELLNSLGSPDGSRAIELLDGKSFANGKEAFHYVCDKYGFDAVNKRLGTYAKRQIAGIVREIVHPFDKH